MRNHNPEYLKLLKEIRDEIQEYKDGLDETQELEMTYIKEIKKEITEILSADPSLVPYLMEYDLRNLPKDEKRLIEDVLGKEYLNTLIKHFQSQQ